MKSSFYSLVRLTTRVAPDKRNLALLLTLALLVIASSTLVYAQTDPPTVAVTENQVTYTKAGDPIVIAPELVLTGSTIERASVSIDENFNTNEDRLGIVGSTDTNGTIGTISWEYKQATGVLTLTGDDTVANYQSALRQVTYHNVSDSPTGDRRTVSFTSGSSLFFEGTGNYYEYVAAPSISWNAARAAAEQRKLGELTGYLVTVTSAEENAFIAQKLRGDGWMGASDAENHGEWKWVTGPEAGTVFFKQTLDARGCGFGGTTEPNQYANWAPNEPNDARAGDDTGCADGENHAHFLGPDNPLRAPLGTWNDYTENPAGVSADDTYHADGYVVEYGGLPGETAPQLSAEVTIQLVDTPPPPPASESTCTCPGATNASAPAPTPGVLDQFAPISIYSLDNGSLEDSVAGEHNSAAGRAFGFQQESGTPTPSTPTTTADRFGNEGGAILFDGVNDYIETNEPSNINPLTFSVWFRADDISGERSIVDSDRSGAYGHSLIIGYDDPNRDDDTPGDGSLDVQYHNGFWDTNVIIEQGVWYHAFVTYGTGMQLYLGKQGEPLALVAEQPYTETSFDGDNFRFGRHNAGDPQYFKGAMDDIRFYDKALDLQAINEVAGCTCPDSEPPARPEKPIPYCAWGDVHFRTPDGLTFDIQDEGDYILTKSSTGIVNVQTRQTQWPATTNEVSVNTAVALDVAADRLELYLNPVRFFVNGTPTDLPSTPLSLTNGGIIYPADSGNDFTVVWPDGHTGARVWLKGSGEKAYLDVGIQRLGGSLTYEGLCGNLDGDAANDALPNHNWHVEELGETLLFHIPFARTRADDDAVLISDSANAVQLVSYNALPAVQSDDSGGTLTLLNLDPAARMEAWQFCQESGITEPIALNTCTYDVAVTGDPVFVESAETFQAILAQLPPEERVSVAADPAQGLLIDQATLPGPTTDPVDPVDTTDPVDPVDQEEDPQTVDELASNPAGLLSNPLVLGGLGLLVVVILFAVFRRRA